MLGIERKYRAKNYVVRIMAVALFIVFCMAMTTVIQVTAQKGNTGGTTKGGEDLILNPPCPGRDDGDCDDFITGGGWIVGTPSGARGNFGVHGGITNRSLWGGLNYIDHGTGMHVSSTAVTGYTHVGTNGRQISYTVTIDGQPGTAIVIVVDNGEPGRNDTFSIQLSNGYSAAGDLGGARPGGGNIQLHRRCPGDDDDEPENGACGRVTIIKEVSTFGGGTSSTAQFGFTANPRFGPTTFTLVDDDGGPGRDRISQRITSFGPANSITITEQAMAGWTLLDIACVETVNNTTVNLGTRTANIVVDPGEHVVCTFRNGQVAPTAARVTLSGRALTSDGQGVARAMITVTNVSSGESRTVVTNQFGHYRVDQLEGEQVYFVAVSSKRYEFVPNSRTLMLQEDVAHANFTASPR